MHSDIVNGHQLLCDAHTVLEQDKGNAARLLSTFCPFPLILLCICYFDCDFT